MIKLLNHKVIKTAIGVCIAIYLAELFKIEFPATAGIVTILSIEATKKETIKVALERFVASLIGLFIVIVLLYFLGYNPIVFGLFVLIFMPICLRLGIYSGFLCTVVLGTHILTLKTVSADIVLNEIFILLLGIAVALPLNLYMPDKKKELEKRKIRIDELMKKIIIYFGEQLNTGAISVEEEKVFNELKNELDRAKDIAYSEYNNDLFDNSTKEIDYIQMRKNQYKVLLRMRKHFSRFYLSSVHANMVAEFTKKVAGSVKITCNYEEAYKELENLREVFKDMPLPQTRLEFQSRAMFIEFVNDIEDFLEIKKEHIDKWRTSFLQERV